ncbi:ATPase AAA [Spirochaeta lutea]|uniref:DNA 3'-5' helicase n=1 Tax=Spirochaeta lutea TaxID=1480694 RepID=A0A098R0R9_9SPIO|nr:UvrD-helicase domain-containing protein [Spirochaeta lutea]KGE73584.1 ATPase AAA [Spirochaeta lutea]
MIDHLRRALNPEQFTAVTTIEGPVLIIAGAGSGKTRVITYRIAYMLSEGINQSNILALTFTNKAAREMEERVKELTGKKLRQLTVSTFHAFGVQILKKHITRLGYRENFSIYDTGDQISLIKETARELKIPEEKMDYSKILSLFSRIKTRRVTWREVDDSFRPLYKEYLSHLRLYNALDFDDLIALPIQLFEEHPDVLEEYRSQYRYIMVDEFQDTSLLQYRFMKLIADGSRNICVVGDDDQSIYSWRGANFENILNFEKDFSELREIKLEQNYRSTGTILDAANSVIANNKNRKIKQLWSGTQGGKPIELYQPVDEKAEAEFICDMIKTLAVKEGIKYHDVGVLIRTNALSRSLEESFLAANIPYKMSGGTSFFQRQEIKDIICYLRTITNPDDDISLLRILNTPRRGIGKKTLEVITTHAIELGSSLYGAMIALLEDAQNPLGTKTRSDIQDFLSLIDEYRPKLLSGKRLADSTRQLIQEIDYWSHLVQEFQKNDKVAKWRMRNIEIFTNSIEDYEKDPDNLNPSIFSYLNRITLSNRDDEDDDQGKVNLMTIHSAKGLEHEIVFLVGVEDNIIPHQRSLTENEEGDFDANMEEERRLFYVAITRAKQKLFMTACQQRRVMRESISCQISPFVQEIPSQLIEIKEPQALPEFTEEDADSVFSMMQKRFGPPAQTAE